MKNKYKHFNPEEHRIDVQMAKVRASSHSKHNINYHIVFIPKYRKAVLVGDKLKEILSTIIKGQCEDLQCELLALEVMPDHIHLFVSALPTHTPFEIVKKIKGNTSRQLRLVFKNLAYLGFQKHYKAFPNLWARGYYIGSAGHVSQEAVKRYILEQQGKDVFEYNVYGGDGKQKIGDFTQDLKRWVK